MIARELGNLQNTQHHNWFGLLYEHLIANFENQTGYLHLLQKFNLISTPGRRISQ